MFPAVTPRAQHLIDTLKKFVEEECIPNEERYERELGEGADRWKNEPPVVEELRIKAKKLGLWNLFLPKEYKESPGLTNYEYAQMCEIMGRSSHIAPTVTNCNAPDTGNMEVFAKYGNDAQKQKWLVPLMEGKIRSSFAMTEPAVPSSDATNISCKLSHTKGGYLINGKKWWISNAGHPNLKVFLVMVRSGKTNEELANSPGGIGLKDIHNQHSVVIVPSDTPGVRVGRPLHVFGYDDAPHGHCEVTFDNVFIPHENMILGEGRGFEIIQGRLGPGRLHHAMRSIGVAERAFDTMVDRAMGRVIQGQPLVEKGVIMDWIAKSRIELDSARLLVLNASHAVDVKGARRSKKEIALAKIYVPNIALAVIDRAIQVHGAMGVCQDTPLAGMYAGIRTLRLADGPDEVHAYQIARNEIKIAKARLESKL
ncbi:hypothetical protein BB559_003762 [Furculomyces boomerangus]|uniref:Acyl-CoA dehydrogenase n=2 Tax=Harpellales TaxID=61421 RepID=A0A2T9YIT0_9FUNG|nr:hypothetical protein BB559_006533 [Furculomyces boomerangus]PVU92262.1 hypothetical protein BB559_003762 [Furculomyces boomerangus]PWA00647.1 hypothetical protein BB558_003295 [Smittium angustum]